MSLREELKRYDKVCDNCHKKFNIYLGEGLGTSYFKPNAMLPSTTYLCMDCFNKMKAKGLIK